DQQLVGDAPVGASAGGHRAFGEGFHPPVGPADGEPAVGAAVQDDVGVLAVQLDLHRAVLRRGEGGVEGGGDAAGVVEQQIGGVLDLDDVRVLAGRDVPVGPLHPAQQPLHQIEGVDRLVD